MQKKEITIGGLLFAAGILVGFSLSLTLNGKTSAVTQEVKVELKESRPTEKPVAAKSTVEKVKQTAETTEEACKRLGVTEAELAELWQIAAARGETTLPSRDWVEHVYRPRKKARSSAR